jgi:hypothetical protein
MLIADYTDNFLRDYSFKLFFDSYVTLTAK